MEDILDAAGTGILVCDADWRVQRATAPAASLLDIDDADTLTDTTLSALLPADVAESVRTAVRDGEDPVRLEAYLPGVDRWLAVRAVATGEGQLVELTEVSRWASQLRDLQRARDDRKQLEGLVALVSDILGAVLTAGTHEAIQDAITTELVTGDLFEFAWVGDWAADGEGLALRAAGGDADFQAVVAAATDDCPERDALAAGDPVVVTDLAAAESVQKPVRKAAFARGIQACIALPLSYGDSVFGVLGLYTAREQALEEPGRAGIETLGEVVGFALHATRQRQALDTATRRELVLGLGAETGPLARAATTTEASLALEGTASVEADALVVYVSVEGSDAAAVREAADADDAITEARVIEATDDGGLCELRLGESALCTRLTGLGATIRDAALSPQEARLTVDVPPQTNVSTFLDRLTSAGDEVDLLATRTRERAARTTAAVEHVLGEELTERQRAALEAAYEAGYFESPRDSTAEAVADSLGIAGPTFSHHLRIAQRKLLAAVFADQGSRSTE